MTLDNLLSRREEVRQTEKTLTEEIISEAEKYVLSAVYLGCRINDSNDISEPAILTAVQRLYDKRLDNLDIGRALKNLVEAERLSEHKKNQNHPSDYSFVGKVEIKGKVTLVEFYSQQELKELRDKSDLPF